MCAVSKNQKWICVIPFSFLHGGEERNILTASLTKFLLGNRHSKRSRGLFKK